MDSRHQRYVIDCRKPDGTLDFSPPQPEDIFGMGAITGISDDAIARRIFRDHPDASLRGDSISQWPRLMDPRFSARAKYW